MYLFIFEGYEMLVDVKYTEDDVKAVDAGILSIVDMEHATNLLPDGTWNPIEMVSREN